MLEDSIHFNEVYEPEKVERRNCRRTRIIFACDAGGVLTLRTTDAEEHELRHYQMRMQPNDQIQILQLPPPFAKRDKHSSGTEATFVIEGNVEEFVHHVRSLCQKVPQYRVLKDL
jgi:hypothetical protein